MPSAEDSRLRGNDAYAIYFIAAKDINTLATGIYLPIKRFNSLFAQNWS
jgi:hypothetical protein